VETSHALAFQLQANQLTANKMFLQAQCNVNLSYKHYHLEWVDVKNSTKSASIKQTNHSTASLGLSAHV